MWGGSVHARCVSGLTCVQTSTPLHCSDLLECQPREGPELLLSPLGVRPLRLAHKLGSTFRGIAALSGAKTAHAQVDCQTAHVAWKTAPQAASALPLVSDGLSDHLWLGSSKLPSTSDVCALEPREPTLAVLSCRRRPRSAERPVRCARKKKHPLLRFF